MLNNEKNIYDKFCNIDEDYIIRLSSNINDEKCSSILMRLLNFRHSFSRSNPNRLIYPHLTVLITIICDLSDKRDSYQHNGIRNTLDAVSKEIELEALERFSEYIISNLSSVEYEVSFAYYIHCSNKLDKINETAAHIDNYVSEIRKCKDEVRDIYANTGVHLFATEFNDIAKKEKFAKIIWLLVSMTMIVCTLIYLFYINSYVIDKIDVGSNKYHEALYVFVVRMPTIFILLLGFSWVSKRYIAAREKEIVYRHIASTLHTFKSFYGAVDESHKSLVLMEAAKVIFPPPSEKDSTASYDGARMLDVVKLLSKAASQKGETT